MRPQCPRRNLKRKYMLGKIGENKWQIDIIQGMQARYRERWSGTEAQANIYYRKLQIELGVIKEAHTVRLCLDEYLAECLLHDSPKTHKDRARILSGPIATFCGDYSPDNISKTLITAYQSQGIDEIVNHSTRELRTGKVYTHGQKGGHRQVNLELAYFRAYVSWMIEHGHCVHQLPRVKALKITKKAPPTQKKDVIVRIINAMEPFWSRFFTLVFQCGLRQDEIRNLRWRSVLWDSRCLKILGKGNRERIVALSRTAWDAIVAPKEACPHEEDDYVFVSAKKPGKPFVDVRKATSRALKKAALTEHITPHMFRHSFASALHSKGVDIAVIQGLLGHADIQTTQIYTKVDRTLMARAVKLLDEPSQSSQISALHDGAQKCC